MTDDKKPSEKALQIAAKCWCDEKTSDRVMDIELAIAFAKRLDNDYAAIAALTERNISLRESLKLAVEALEACLVDTPGVSSCGNLFSVKVICSTTLTKIKAKGGEL